MRIVMRRWCCNLQAVEQLQVSICIVSKCHHGWVQLKDCHRWVILILNQINMWFTIWMTWVVLQITAAIPTSKSKHGKINHAFGLDHVHLFRFSCAKFIMSRNCVQKILMQIHMMGVCWWWWWLYFVVSSCANSLGFEQLRKILIQKSSFGWWALMILLTYASVGQITKCMLLGGRWGESCWRKHSLMTTSKKIHRKSIISFGVPAILQVPQMIFRIVFFLGWETTDCSEFTYAERWPFHDSKLMEFHDVLFEGRNG